VSTKELVAQLLDAGIVAVAWDFDGEDGDGTIDGVGGCSPDDLPQPLVPGEPHTTSVRDLYDGTEGLGSFQASQYGNAVRALCDDLLVAHFPVLWTHGGGTYGYGVVDLRTGAVVIEGHQRLVTVVPVTATTHASTVHAPPADLLGAVHQALGSP
jgi:hypothetical protein